MALKSAIDNVSHEFKSNIQCKGKNISLTEYFYHCSTAYKVVIHLC